MDKLRAMATFVHIVDGGSLTVAAEALQTSLPSVVRALAALEAELGVRLLNRTTRRLSLTDEGREYCERCRHVLAAIDEAEAALSTRRVAPKGRLRVTAPVLFGRMRVAPVATEFLVENPAIRLELLLLDRVVDLVEEGIDAGVHIGVLPESSLVAIPVGETRRVVCASPAYLEEAGVPGAPGDLAAHRCIAFSGIGPTHEWSFGGRPRARIGIRPAFTTNQIDAALEACLRGFGCAQFLSYQVRSALDAGRLVRLLPAFEPAAVPIHVIYPHTRLLSANVRAFVDFAVPRLRKRLRGAS
jgi:DNA-binding transcriptional LysR family regulator